MMRSAALRRKWKRQLVESRVVGNGGRRRCLAVAGMRKKHDEKCRNCIAGKGNGKKAEGKGAV
jgi:hypothetical protein